MTQPRLGQEALQGFKELIEQPLAELSNELANDAGSIAEGALTMSDGALPWAHSMPSPHEALAQRRTKDGGR